jgi:hypothetical protein
MPGMGRERLTCEGSAREGVPSARWAEGARVRPSGPVLAASATLLTLIPVWAGMGPGRLMKAGASIDGDRKLG